jgi:hypothetical protein
MLAETMCERWWSSGDERLLVLLQVEREKARV